MSKALPAVTARYWASIRSAAGIDSEQVEGATLAEVLSVVSERHPDRRFQDLLSICSVLIDSQPVGAREPADVAMSSGAVVEFLPPFAGGALP
jgi:molybdopterin converting factor small subunit